VNFGGEGEELIYCSWIQVREMLDQENESEKRNPSSLSFSINGRVQAVNMNLNFELGGSEQRLGGYEVCLILSVITWKAFLLCYCI